MTEMTGMIAVVAAENSKRKDIRPDQSESVARLTLYASAFFNSLHEKFTLRSVAIQ